MPMAARLVPGFFFLLCLLDSPGLEAQVADSFEACRASHWSPPRLLEEHREDAFTVEHASIAANSRGEIFIAGRGPRVRQDSMLLVAFPFAAYSIDAQGRSVRLPSPAHDGAYSYPRLAIVNDTVHMFWGEPDTTAVFEAGPEHRDISPSVKSIWAASYVDGWSEPKFLGRHYAGKHWHELRYSSRGSSSSSLHTPVSAGHKISWLGLDGSAPIPDLNFTPHGFYPWIVYPGPSEIVVGYIAPDDGYSVSVLRSTDNGRSWSERVRVAPGLARDVTLVETPNGLLHAIWSHDDESVGSTGFTGQRIGYAVSSDKGRTWTAPTYLAAKNQIWMYRVVADRDGNLHLLFEDDLQEKLPGANAWPALYYTTRSADSGWSEPTILFEGTAIGSTPELTITRTGELVLLFKQRLGTRGDSSWWASAVSRLRPGRDCVVRP